MNILYFFLGMLCYEVFIPIIDSIVTLIQTYLETKKGALSVKVLEYNKILNEDEEESTNAIGFIYEPKEELQEEDEEE